jgi:hypothetical protein
MPDRNLLPGRGQQRASKVEYAGTRARGPYINPDEGMHVSAGSVAAPAYQQL